MKIVAFIVALLAGVPVLAIAARRSQKIEDALFCGLVVANCVAIDINLISYADYRGTTRGTEVGLVDIIGMALTGCWLMAARHRRSRFQIPRGMAPFLVYLLFGLPGLVLSEAPHFVAFEVMKYLRGMAMFWLVASIVRTERQIELALKSMVGVLLYETFVFLKQRYLGGIHRVPGTFDHANVLSMYLYLHAAVLWPYVVAVKSAPRKLGLMAIGGAALGAIMALSRGGLLLLPLSIVLGTMLSIWSALHARGRGWSTDRKRLKRIGTIVMICLLAAIPVLVMAMDTLYKRFAVGNKKGTEGRFEKNAVAFAMAEDHTLGVGLNNFAHMTLKGYRYREFYTIGQESYEAKEALGLKVYHAPVHNLFLLVASETGWPSLPVFITAQLYLLFLALKLGRRGPTPLLQALGAGAFAMNLAVFAHGMLEYQIRVTNIWFAFFFVAGLVAAGLRITDEQRRMGRRKKRG